MNDFGPLCFWTWICFQVLFVIYFWVEWNQTASVFEAQWQEESGRWLKGKMTNNGGPTWSWFESHCWCCSIRHLHSSNVTGYDRGIWSDAWEVKWSIMKAYSSDRTLNIDGPVMDKNVLWCLGWINKNGDHDAETEIKTSSLNKSEPNLCTHIRRWDSRSLRDTLMLQRGTVSFPQISY